MFSNASWEPPLQDFAVKNCTSPAAMVLEMPAKKTRVAVMTVSLENIAIEFEENKSKLWRGG